MFSLFATGAWAWSDQQDERWRNLNEELRCLVCQNQSIAESHAELAKDLRQQVRSMIEAGKTDQDIRDYMTARYGDFVLYRPPFKPLTWLLWLGPGFMLLLGLGVLWRLRRTSSNEIGLSAQQKQQNQQLVASALKDIKDD